MIYQAKKKERDPRRYWLDEKDCERLTRKELMALQMLLVMLSIAANLMDDLTHRLECIPNGKKRMRMAVGGEGCSG